MPSRGWTDRTPTPVRPGHAGARPPTRRHAGGGHPPAVMSGEGGETLDVRLQMRSVWLV